MRKLTMSIVLYQLFFGALMCTKVDCSQEKENSMTLVIPKNITALVPHAVVITRLATVAVNCDVCFITSVIPSKYLNVISFRTRFRGCNKLSLTGQCEVLTALPWTTEPWDSRILYAWNKDIPVFDVHLPNGTGYRIGRETSVKYIELQVRYLVKLSVSDDYYKKLWVKVYWTKDKLTPVLPIWMTSRHGIIPPGNITPVDVSCEDTYYPIDIVAYRPIAFKYELKVTAYIIDDCNGVDTCNWTVVDSIDPRIPKNNKFFTVDPPILVRGIQMLAVRGIFKNTGNEPMRLDSPDYGNAIYLWVYLIKDHGDKYKRYIIECEKNGPPYYTFSKDTLEFSNIPPIPH